MAAAWTSYLDEHGDRFLDELIELLRIPSVSTEPRHADDVRRAAEWVARRLAAAGLENVQLLTTSRHPVVYADWLHAPGQPTILLYGHCDVQPVDPVELWSAAPFDPRIEGDRRDGRLFARGASDMKGNLVATIAAVEALLATTGRLPVNVKYFVEAEEEIGSPSIPAFLAEQRQRFACDVVVSADGGQGGEQQPELTLGSRGLAGVQIDVRGAASDLHSGLYGGAAPNPLHALVALLGSLRGPDGAVLVPGFYDDVAEPTAEERAIVATSVADDAELRQRLGARRLLSAPGYTPQESTTLRPTLELNGVWGGFQGDGVKTVIPAEAHAKITCRLVPNQDPERIAELIAAHVRASAPDAVEVAVTPLPGRAYPARVPADHPTLRAAAAALTELYGRPPERAFSGGTLPVAGLFLRLLGAHTIGFGFSLDDERFHAPDEFYRLASFRRAQQAYCLLLERLGADA